MNTSTRNSPAQLLAKVGRALYGERWKADMAHDINQRAALTHNPLRVSVDRIDDWSKGRGAPPPVDIWLELAGFIQDRRQVLPDLHAEVLLAADPPDQVTEIPVSPALAGVSFSRQYVDEINRRIGQLAAGHALEGSVLYLLPRAAALLRVPRPLRREEIDEARRWIAEQTKTVRGGIYNVDPFRTTNAGGSFS